MAYERTVWENGITPINAANLNNIEEGIVEAGEEIVKAWKEIVKVNENLPKKIEMVKLWQNASPTSAFVAQTLNIDFSAYGALLFDFYGSGTFIKMISDVTGAVNVNYMYENTNGTVALGHRFVVADVAGKKTITFNAGRYAQLSGASSYVTENTILRPLFIYGIKGVQ